MCSFITRHSHRCGKSWGSAQWACWLLDCPAEPLPLNWTFISPVQDFLIQHLHLKDHLRPASRTAAATIALHNRRISQGSSLACECRWILLMVLWMPSYSLAPVVPFIHNHQLMLQHDNAQLHAARICAQFLEVLAWLAWSYAFDCNSWKKKEQKQNVAFLFLFSVAIYSDARL